MDRCEHSRWVALRALIVLISCYVGLIACLRPTWQCYRPWSSFCCSCLLQDGFCTDSGLSGPCSPRRALCWVWLLPCCCRALLCSLVMAGQALGPFSGLSVREPPTLLHTVGGVSWLSLKLPVAAIARQNTPGL